MLLRSAPTHQATSATANVEVGAMAHSRKVPLNYRFRFQFSWAGPVCGSGGVLAAGKKRRLSHETRISQVTDTPKFVTVVHRTMTQYRVCAPGDASMLSVSLYYSVDASP